MDKLDPTIRKDILTKIISRAWKDPKFKEKLFANPKEALQDMHLPIPENMKINVVEEGQKYARENKSVFTIIIPKQPPNAHQLSEQELASLAGAGNIEPEQFGLGTWID